MNVRLHKTGQDGASASLYHNTGVTNFFANAYDSIPANEQVARHDRVRFGHRH